jgi:hemoglobin-like flavoprotein
MAPETSPHQAVEASLMLAAERAGDITDAVYARLFARHPAMQAEFWRDKTGAIRGEMLAKVFDAILDLCGPAAWAPAYLETEIVTHDAYGIPRDIFGEFFAVIGETVRAAVGPDWTPDMAAGWAWLDGIARAAMQPPAEDNAARRAAVIA